MVCKRCGTRLENIQTTCPNCGRSSGRFESGELGLPEGADPSQGAQDEASPEKAAPAQAPKDAPKAKEGAKAKAAAKAKREPSAKKKPASSPAVPIFDLEPEAVRALLAEHPEVLEPGLRVFADERGKAIGAGYSAVDVGEIDVLAMDADGQFVVVMVSERDAADAAVGEVLPRVGWVRKHLANDKNVRGIVVLCQAPESLKYSAAAVADTVSFKTYQMALTFSDVEL
jgi:predicted  nucleic acid-binding Zn-ribbon protein